MRNQHGSTMAEVLLALFLLAVGILALVGVLAGGLNQMSRSEELTEAAYLARDFFENVRKLDPAVIPENASYDGDTPALDGFPPAPYPGFKIRGRQYNFKVETTRLGDFTVSLKVEVSWPDGGPVKYETYVTR